MFPQSFSGQESDCSTGDTRDADQEDSLEGGHANPLQAILA